MCHAHHHHEMRRPLGFLVALWILKRLKSKPEHGYKLSEEVNRELGLDVPRPHVYAILRRLEEKGLIVGEWKTDEPGPARRVYRITELGVEFLRRWLDFLKKVRHALDKILEGE